MRNVFYSEGNLPEAKQHYQQSLKFDQQINDPQGLASDYGNLANTLGDQGDLAGSLKMQQQALAAFEEIGDRRESASTMDDLGNVLAEMGDLVQAKSYSQKGRPCIDRPATEAGKFMPLPVWPTYRWPRMTYQEPASSMSRRLRWQGHAGSELYGAGRGGAFDGGFGRETVR